MGEGIVVDIEDGAGVGLHSGPGRPFSETECAEGVREGSDEGVLGLVDDEALGGKDSSVHC